METTKNSNLLYDFGLWRVIKFMRHKGVASFIDRISGGTIRKCKYGHGDKFVALMINFFLRNDSISDIDDIKVAYPFLHIPSSHRVYNFIKVVTDKDDFDEILKPNNVQTEKSKYKDNQLVYLKRLNIWLIQFYMLLRLKDLHKNRMDIELDQTIHPNDNPDSRYSHKKGVHGYASTVIMINRVPVHILGSGGNTNPKYMQLETFKQFETNLLGVGLSLRGTYFRADSASCQIPLMQYLRNSGVTFVITARSTIYKHKLENITYWDTVTLGTKKKYQVKITSIKVDHIPGEKPLRVVLVRGFNLKTNKPDRGIQFTRGLITNDYTSTDAEIATYYAQRGTTEQRFCELKKFFGWGKSPFMDLLLNMTYYTMSAMSYQLFLAYKEHEIENNARGIDRTSRLKKVHNRLIKGAGTKQEFIKLSGLAA